MFSTVIGEIKKIIGDFQHEVYIDKIQFEEESMVSIIFRRNEPSKDQLTKWKSQLSSCFNIPITLVKVTRSQSFNGKIYKRIKFKMKVS